MVGVMNRSSRAILSGVLAAVLAPAAARAQFGASWRADDRVMLSDFGYIGAVATDQRRVYAATPNGLEIYDYTSGRWELPSTFEDGYPAGERPTALAHDPLQSELILATSNGLVSTIWRLRLIDGRWERGPALQTRAVLAIVPSSTLADDAFYLNTMDGWMRLGRIGIFADPVSPAQVPEDVRARAVPLIQRIERDPGFSAWEPHLGFDDHRRRWALTSAAAEEYGSGLWVGRAGGNLVRFDTRSYSIENHTFGLVSRGVGAIAQDGSGALWFGSDGRGQRVGLTRVLADLSSSKMLESMFERVPSRAVTQILPIGDTLWVAALDGLYRCAPCSDADQSRWDRFGETDGLPVSEVTGLAATRAGLWVATRRGLVRWSGDDAEPRFVGQRINRLAVHADTLLIATDRGLWLMPVSDSIGDGSVAPAPVPGGRIVDVVVAGSDIVATDGRSLYRRRNGTWTGPERIEEAGRVTRLYATPTHLWVAGDRGVAAQDLATRAWQSLRVPGDVPEGPVIDLLVTDTHVWLATPAGALRITLRR